jgi:TrmH family RNA methyltransferase
MLSKQQIKFINSLKHNKYRLKYNCFVAEGSHVVNEFIKSNFKLKLIISTNEWQIKSKVKTLVVDKKTLKKISFLKTASSVLAVFYKPDTILRLDDFVIQKYTILLDSISDPGNMGSIIRTSDWYGVKEIFVSKESVDVFNPKVIQSSMGSLSRVRVHAIDVIQLLTQLKKKQVPCFGATLLGEDVYDMQKPDCCALVFGSESHGISKEVKKLLDKEILIPSKNKLIDSLNVSVAFGIILSEFR